MWNTGSVSRTLPWRCRPVAAIAAAAMVATAAIPAQAGNSWALPLLGGAVGGYAISSFVNSRKSQPPPPPVHHTAPRPVAPAPSPVASTEARLQQLDQLAAGGYITKAEYAQRRQAILDTL